MDQEINNSSLEIFYDEGNYFVGFLEGKQVIKQSKDFGTEQEARDEKAKQEKKK